MTDMLRSTYFAPAILSASILLAGCLSTGNVRDRSSGSGGGHVVTAEDIEAAGNTTIEELLIARVPGVRRSPDGSGIVLRGPDSVQGSNAPLWVIDGVPSVAGARHVNMYDIAEIEVLSSASSTAAYGMQGMNGVIHIRTKEPGQ